MIRHVDPLARRSIVGRLLAVFSTTRVGRFLSRHVAWKIDPILLRLSGGRIAMTFGIPVNLLETRGAKTGALRRNAVIYFHDGDRVTVVASHAGDPRHPAWYHNLCADPHVVFGGVRMRASVVTDETERDRLWSLADRVFAPYAIYRRDAGRIIPIVQLTPSPSGRSASGVDP